MDTSKLNLLLADDDEDDCILFKEALAELPLNATLSIVHNGVELMEFLNDASLLPDMLFLDLNMPLKTGYDCMAEIRDSATLCQLRVIIFSTSNYPDIVNWLYKQGAYLYIRKPGTFKKLKEVIHFGVRSVVSAQHKQPARENFVLDHT